MPVQASGSASLSAESVADCDMASAWVAYPPADRAYRSRGLPFMGRWVDSSNGEVREVTNPGTGEVLDTVPTATTDVLETAIQAAQHAKKRMGSLLAHKRYDILSATADTVRQPIGVVAAIVPFNYPIELYAHKGPAAVAAGNAVIVKPSGDCPLTLLRIAGIVEQSGLPVGAHQTPHWRACHGSRSMRQRSTAPPTRSALSGWSFQC